jgi:redox-sensitive bicupin YhaK (pirin superfamily)
MLDGTIRHPDSHGGGGVITDGASQWMTAGAAIVHSEMLTDDLVRTVQAIEDYQAGRVGEIPAEPTA